MNDLDLYILTLSKDYENVPAYKNRHIRDRQTDRQTDICDQKHSHAAFSDGNDKYAVGQHVLEFLHTTMTCLSRALGLGRLAGRWEESISLQEEGVKQ